MNPIRERSAGVIPFLNGSGEARGVEDRLPRVEVPEIRIINTDETVHLKMEHKKPNAGKS
jgi:hypothetical protein